MGGVKFYYLAFLKTGLFKTIYFNFRYLPFRQAKHLPFIISKHTRILTYGKGNIELVLNDDAGGIRFGMIKLGFANMPVQHVKSNPLSICLTNGTRLVFKGKGRISAGSQIYLRGGNIELGHDVHVGMNVRIISSNSIKIGSYTTIGWGTQITDTDFHYVVNTKTEEVYPQCKKITIGDHCWICNCCSIMKGTFLPDYVIVGARSLCNKEYNVPRYSMIAGIPAVLKREGLRYEY